MSQGKIQITAKTEDFTTLSYSSPKMEASVGVSNQRGYLEMASYSFKERGAFTAD